jgi:hypothetical protein
MAYDKEKYLMIILYTDYDPVTSVLASYARRLNEEVGAKVSKLLAPPDGADTQHAEAELADNPAPFFFFGHGNRSGLIAQDHATIDFNKTPHLLSDRLVCATCCQSTVALAAAAANHGATIVGYSGDLAVFLNPPYSHLMEDCLLSGPRALVSGKSAAEAGRHTRSELERLAQHLIAGPIEDQVYAPFLQMNANLVKVI